MVVIYIVFYRLILKKTCLLFINTLSDEFYEKIWYIICEQLKFGEKSLKIVTFKLVLTMLDLRILALNKFDFSYNTYIYFIDCLFATYEILFTDDIQFNDENLAKGFIENNEIVLGNQSNDELALELSLIVNRLFNNQQSFITNLSDINNFLIQSIEIIRISNFNNRSVFLSDSFFSMILNLSKEKLQFIRDNANLTVSSVFYGSCIMAKLGL